MKISTLLLILFLLFSSSCATIIKDVFDNKQLVTFKSEPEGAMVSVNGINLGKTPLTIGVDANKEAVYSLSLEGYKHHQERLFTTLDSKFLGNILFIYGSTTDFVTENMWKYHPNSYFVQLEPKSFSMRDTNWDRRNKIYNFVFKNKRKLLNDFAKGGTGEVSASLLKLTSITKEKFKPLVGEFLDTPDPLIFSNSLISVK